MKYETEADIDRLVSLFETGMIARGAWDHAGHLTVALCYLWRHDFAEALDRMRRGIFDLLRAFEVDLAKEMPYHETLTVFWMRAVEDFKNSAHKDSLVEVCNELIEKFDKDYPLRFYSRELLFSAEARAKFVEPDRPVQ